MKAIEIAMKAGRLRQSPVTGFVHHSYEHPDRGSEAIPVYENFCFALALFRTKIAENVLEGKALLERLFAFQTSEGFPLYLHEFPQCKSRRLGNKLSIVAQFLLRDFTSVLGEKLRAKLESIVLPSLAIQTRTPEEWADFLIQTQLTGDEPVCTEWDSEALCYVGPQKQARDEPAVTLLDIVMGEWTGKMSTRALVDAPVHIQASLVYPRTTTPATIARGWSRRFWGSGQPTHSALLDVSGSWVEEGECAIIDLPEKEVHDEVEITYFISRHPGTQFSVYGLKSTTFQLDEPLRVESGGDIFEITFSLLEGSGKFWGHLHLGNRPGQLVQQHEAFDWKIALRTIERSKPCRIKINFNVITCGYDIRKFEQPPI